jgi:ankyrin repeat protein
MEQSKSTDVTAENAFNNINEVISKKNKADINDALIIPIKVPEILSNYGFILPVLQNLPSLSEANLVDIELILSAIVDNIIRPELIKDPLTQLSLFSYFCQKGDLSFALRLAEKVGNFNEPDCIGYPAIYHACMSGNLELVKALHELYSIPLTFVDNKGETLLHAATANGNLELVTYLLDMGLDPNKKETRYDLNCLSTAAFNTNNPAILKALKLKGASYNSDNYYNLSPLKLSILRFHFDNVTYFIQQGFEQDLPFATDDIQGAMQYLKIENNEKRGTQEYRLLKIKTSFSEYIITQSKSIETVLIFVKDHEQIHTVALLFNKTPLELLQLDLDSKTRDMIKIAVMI